MRAHLGCSCSLATVLKIVVAGEKGADRQEKLLQLLSDLNCTIQTDCPKLSGIKCLNYFQENVVFLWNLQPKAVSLFS